jgi:hypothetical protein
MTSRHPAGFTLQFRSASRPPLPGRKVVEWTGWPTRRVGQPVKSSIRDRARTLIESGCRDGADSEDVKRVLHPPRLCVEARPLAVAGGLGAGDERVDGVAA